MTDVGRAAALRLAARHGARSLGDWWLLLLALVVAVAAVTAVNQITARVRAAMLAQGAATLAGNLRLTLRAPLAEQRAAQLAATGVAMAGVTTFSSTLARGDALTLVSVKAVTHGYPLRGRLTLRRGPPGTSTFKIAHGPPAGQVWVGQRVLDTLGAHVGDTLKLGDAHFRIGAVIGVEPDRGPRFGDIAPRVMMARQDVAATGLLGPGSRAHYAELFAGPPAAIARLRNRLEPTLGPGQRLQTPTQANRALARALQRADRFLDLAALAAVVLAAVAIALTARRHAESRLDEIALLKSLGAARRLITRMLAWQLAIAGALGIGLGLAAGTLAQYAIAGVLAAALGIALPATPLASVWPGPIAGAILLAGFAWPAIAAACRAPPARVLARSLAAAPARGFTIYTAAITGLVVLAAAATRDIAMTGWVLGGAAAGAAILAAAALALLWAVERLRRGAAARAGPGIRLGLAALSRRRSASVLQIVAFGAGLIMLFTLVVVRGDLLAGWQADIAADAPNRFLVNITPAQRAPVADFLAAKSIDDVRFYPIVRARMTAVNHRAIDKNPALAKSAGELVKRALNLSWAARLKTDNTVIAGHWFGPGQAGKPVASIATSVAERLDVGVGDTLAFDIAGRPLRVTIASIRAIDWSSLQANFYVLLPPGVLSDFRATYITSFYLPDTRRAVLASLVRKFSNISVIDIGAILAQLETLIDRVSLAVELVFGFTLAAGLVVLLAAAQANRAERRREAALLRALGARGRWLLQATLVECLLLGACASILAAAVAQIGAIVLATHVFDFDYAWRWQTWLVAIACATATIGITGTAALVGVLRQPAWATLRASE